MVNEGLHPAVGMHSDGEEVRLALDAPWEGQDVILMAIDNYEEEWARLHDVRVNGQVRRWAVSVVRWEFYGWSVVRWIGGQHQWSGRYVGRVND